MGEVIIDGVVFVFDETGTKLVKKGSVPGEASAAPAAASSSSSSSSPSKAPLRTSVNGQSFIRTKRGNLISAELHQQRKAQKESTAKMRRLAAMGDQIASNEKTRCVRSEVATKSDCLCERPLPAPFPPLRSANRKSGRPREAAPASKGLCSFYNKTGLSHRKTPGRLTPSPPSRPCSHLARTPPHPHRPMQARPLMPLHPRRLPPRHLPRRPSPNRLLPPHRPLPSLPRRDQAAARPALRPLVALRPFFVP